MKKLIKKEQKSGVSNRVKEVELILGQLRSNKDKIFVDSPLTSKEKDRELAAESDRYNNLCPK